MNASSPDFPFWLPSALVKELRQGLRTPSFCLLACIFPGLMALLFLFSFLEDPSGNAFTSEGTCNFLLWFSLSLSLMLVMPLRAINSVRMELVSRNHELLLLTRQTAGRLVLGKWASFMAQSLLIVFISLPFFIIRYYYGQIDLVHDLAMLANLCLGSALLTAFALWAAAQPTLLRVIMVMAMTVAIIQGSSFFFMSSTEGLWGNLLIAGLALADTALIVTTMLLQSRTYFAPASENTSAALRQFLLAFFVANILFALLLGGNEELAENILRPQTLFLITYSAILLVIHLNTSAELLPVHVEQMAGKRFSRLRQMLFLPGLPSGVPFALLIAVLAMVSIMVPPWLSAQPGESYPHLDAPPVFLFCLTIGAWYALVAPALALWPYRHKLKQYTLLAYLLLWVPLGLILTTLHSLDLIFPAIPGNDLFHLLKQEHPDEIPGNLVVIAFVNFALLTSMLFLVAKNWFSLRRETAQAIKTALPRPDDASPAQL